jgi:hypothetical protein
MQLMVERKMNLRRLGISLILLSPVFLFFQIWLLFEPNWLNFFGFSHGWTWNSIYYAYLLPSWIFLAVMLSFGLAIYVIETRKISHKRPDGISITAILWLFSGVHSSFISSVTIFSNQAILTSLGVWELEPFLVFRFTFETTLGCLNLFLGVLQILTAYWLWKGRKYSYKLALIVPILLVISNFCSIALYASAPFPFGIGFTVEGAVLGAAWNLVWLSILWWYLRKPHVKAFLGIGQFQSSVQKITSEEKRKLRESMI